MGRADWLDRPAMGHVLAALMPANRLVMECCMATGLRVGDVLALKTADVQHGQRMTVREQKTGKSRRVYWPAEFRRTGSVDKVAALLNHDEGHAEARPPHAGRADHRGRRLNCRAAAPDGPFGAEGAQHGHQPTGPLCAPEHIRGERPGRSRAGEKARPRSARRAWPCLFDGRRKRPHRCPAGACGSIKRGRGVAWPPNRRRKASGCGGGHDRRSRAGSAPHGGPRYLFLPSAPSRQ